MLHLINDGVTVSGNTATVEYSINGPFDAVECIFDGVPLAQCECIIYDKGAWAHYYDTACMACCIVSYFRTSKNYVVLSQVFLDASY